MAVSVDRRTVRWVGAALAMFVPMVVLAIGPWSVNVFLVYLGLLPTLVALREGRTVAVVTAVATPVAAAVGVLLSGSPLLGTAYLTVLAVGITWSWSRGWPGAATYVVTQAALATISPPAGLAVHSAGVALPDPVGLGAVLLGGLWVVLVGWLLLADLPVRAHDAPAREVLIPSGVVLTVLVAIATFVTMTWGPGLHAWWVVLSLLVIVQPDLHASNRRAAERVIGTVVGSFGAALLLIVAGRSGALTVVGVVLGVASAVAYLKASYWIFTTLLTAALVLLTFAPGSVARGELERIGFTVVAALAVVAAGSVSRWVGVTRSRLGQRA